jgi:hypothetical protein
LHEAQGNKEDAMAKQKATTKASGTRTAARRERVDTGSDKRFARRNADGTFKESDDVGRSLAVDRRRRARTKVESGQGDKGDR